MDGAEEVLYPGSGCEAKDVLISLKLNSQLQSLLESDGGTSNMEIEFVSLTEAKIYSGSSVFSLKFSESVSLEIYRRIANIGVHGDSLNCQKKSGLTFCGVAANRYQVITSIEAASEDLRLKRKRESSIREKNAAKSVDTAPKGFTKKPAPQNLPPNITTIPAARTKPSMKAEICPIEKAGKKVVRKLPVETSAPISALPKSSATFKSCPDSGDFKLNWAVIARLPCTVCRDDVCEFLNGLKIRSVYAYYYSEVFSSDLVLPSNLMDIYVQFESEVGINAALLRQGEHFHATVSADYIEAGLDTAKIHKKNMKRKAVSANLRRVTSSEAIWAKSLSLKLDGSFSKCQANLSLVKISFPHYLFSTNPLDSLKKWGSLTQGSTFLHVDELHDLLDQPQKKSVSSSSIFRGANYSEINGLHLDEYQAFCSAGFTGMSCISPIASHNFDLITAQDDLNCSLELNLNHNKAVHEATQILEDLSVVSSNALLSSYSTNAMKDTTDLREPQTILELAHRMSKVYLYILTTLLKLHACIKIDIEVRQLAQLKSPRDASNALFGTFRVVNMRNESPPKEGEDYSRESGIIQWKDNSVIMEIDSKLSIMRCEIDELHKRNEVKDKKKKFEGSCTRVVILMMFTYCALYGYISFLGVDRPELNAIVPTLGFNLSTWSLPYVEIIWQRIWDYYEREKRTSMASVGINDAGYNGDEQV